jgi:hypothetical protein
MSFGKAWVLVALLACGDPLAPPVIDVAGDWIFTGLVSYEAFRCADTLTMHLTQRGAVLAGTTTDWHFTCDTVTAVGPPLTATGLVDADSLALRWATTEAHPTCPICLAFLMVGRLSGPELAGWYQDPVSAVGAWQAQRP